MDPTDLQRLTQFTPLESEQEQQPVPVGSTIYGFLGRLFQSQTSRSSTSSPLPQDEPEHPPLISVAETVESLNLEAEVPTSTSTLTIETETKPVRPSEFRLDSPSGRFHSPSGSVIDAAKLLRRVTRTPSLSRRLSVLFGPKDEPGAHRLLDYNRSDFRQYWMPDSRGKECYECQEKFTTFRRRHHCRICGQIFCSRCCNLVIPGHLLGYMGDLRLCNYCCKSVMQHLTTEETDELERTQSVNEGGGGTRSSSPTFAGSSASLTSPRRPQPVHSDLSVISSGIMWPQHSENTTPINDKSFQFPTNKTRPSVLSVQDLPHSVDDIPEIPSPQPPSPLDEWEPEWVKSIEVNPFSPDSERRFSGDVIPNTRPKSRSSADLDLNSDNISRLGHKSVKFQTQPISIGDDVTDKGYLGRSLPFVPLFPSSPNHDIEEAKSDAGSSLSIDSCCSATEGHGIYRLFESQAIKLLDYLLEREKLDKNVWTKVAWPLCQEIAFTVQPNVRERKDDMDVLAYIHVKMLLSTRNKQQAQVIFGTVCTKSVADNRMPKSLNHPSILVVAGAIEYERVAGKFSSIDPIIMQEADYLRNIVHRLLSSKPQIVVVEKSVARLAQKYLRMAGVTLVYGVKSSILRRIARCTQADIMASVDSQVTRPRLGTCGNFRTETVNLLNGDTKTLMYFDQCQPDLSCSIVIYGCEPREMKAMKRIIRFMISVLQSSKLETELLRLCHVCVDADRHSEFCEKQLSADCRICAENINLSITHSEDALTPRTDKIGLAEAAQQAVFTVSPFIVFSLPFLESSKSDRSKLLSYFKQPLYRFETPDDKFPDSWPLPVKRQVSVYSTPDTVHPFVNEHLTRSISEDLMKGEMAAYRAHGSMLFRKRYRKNMNKRKKVFDNSNRDDSSPSPTPHTRCWLPSGPVDVLNPYHHQRIAVLFGSYSPKSANTPLFCVRPWVVWMEFYGLHDMPLGEFLRRYCFNSTYQCPSPSCEVPMLDHWRKIVHGHACVEINTQTIMEQDQPDNVPRADADNQLLMWDWCGRCKTTTPSRHMSSDLWHLSFAKYLEYLCNGRHLASHTGTPEQNTLCVDCLFHEHDHYFAYNNYITCFKVSTIKLYEVCFSPMVLHIVPSSVEPLLLIADTKLLTEKAGSIFSSMLEQTCLFKVHQEAIKYEKTLIDLLSVHEEGQEAFRQRMSQVQETLTSVSSFTNQSKMDSNDPLFIQVSDGITRCRQLLSAAVLQWNYFVGDFFQMVKTRRSINPLLPDLERVKSAPLLQNQSQISLTLEEPTHVGFTANNNVDRREEPPVILTIGDDSVPNDSSSSSSSFLLPPVHHRNGPKRNSCDPTSHEHAQKPDSPSLRTPASLPKIVTLSVPFDASEHYALPFGRLPIVVRDGEIGSIISYGLSSVEYEQKRRELREMCGQEGLSLTLKMQDKMSSEGLNEEVNPDSDPTNPSAKQHIELQFTDSAAKYYCKTYFAEHFAMLRKLIFADGEDAFIRSLSRTKAWHPKGGKSGASFHRTQDGRFVIKQLSRFEMQSFLKFAPNYFHYLSTAATENKLTALAKILGVYRIGFRNYQTNAAGKMDIFVMEYLFYKRNVSQVYDLKGSLRNRMASEKPANDLVLLDENFLKDLWTNQFYLHPHSKAALNMAISNDSHFLSAHSVMDYSLLVGVDEDRRELVLGIVDYIRTYTLDKKLESYVKIIAVPGGHLPTVISPELYCTRFSEAIETYFAVSPDQWTGLGYGIPY